MSAPGNTKEIKKRLRSKSGSSKRRNLLDFLKQYNKVIQSEIKTLFSQAAGTNGYISGMQLREIFRNMEVSMNQEQFEVLIQELDPEHKDQVTMEALISVLDDLKKQLSTPEESARTAGTGQLLALTPAHLANARQLFTECDTNGDGVISKEELAGVLARLHIDVTADDLTALMDELDEDHSGGISFEEFQDTIKKMQTKSRTVALSRTLNGISRKPSVGDFAGVMRGVSPGGVNPPGIAPRQDDDNVKTLFELCDPEGRGIVTAARLHETMIGLGIHMTADDWTHFLEAVDLDHDGNVTYQELLYGMTHYTPRVSSVAAPIPLPGISHGKPPPGGQALPGLAGQPNPSPSVPPKPRKTAAEDQADAKGRVKSSEQSIKEMEKELKGLKKYSESKDKSLQQKEEEIAALQAQLSDTKARLADEKKAAKDAEKAAKAKKDTDKKKKKSRKSTKTEDKKKRLRSGSQGERGERAPLLDDSEDEESRDRQNRLRSASNAAPREKSSGCCCTVM